ncbi:hypothetical protein H2199_000626 [Coniosporium tulheliwenetii]|uniref:Uncharacterized protein n=1 Tax=Coniosporium tulheliwenetii TaxID=3383036 RepID=A0ACC2ZMC2_9PEZI|nr:hypothetical protein H2199_000626 [Cladosporium sp. JES 115]
MIQNRFPSATSDVFQTAEDQTWPQQAAAGRDAAATTPFQGTATRIPIGAKTGDDVLIHPVSRADAAPQFDQLYERSVPFYWETGFRVEKEMIYPAIPVTSSALSPHLIRNWSSLPSQTPRCDFILEPARGSFSDRIRGFAVALPPPIPPARLLPPVSPIATVLEAPGHSLRLEQHIPNKQLDHGFPTAAAASASPPVLRLYPRCPNPRSRAQSRITPAKAHTRRLSRMDPLLPCCCSSTTRTRTASTERTPRTAGLSRLSDFGSLETAARSDQYDNEDDDLTCQGTDPDDEGEELDSLDDGLHAFHEPSEYSGHSRRTLEQSGDTVLPTHDGLGSFPANTAAMQEQLWQFERHGSRRVRRRRRSSVQRRLDALEEAEEYDEQDERMQRIERWRVEQSKALLEEIERETRRMRRMSRVSAGRSRVDSVHPVTQDAASPKTDPAVAKVAETQTTDQAAESESFLQRFTRRVIRDLIGIDETLLSVIFGEALPAEAQPPSAAPLDSGTAETSSRSDQNPIPHPGQSWEHRLLERIARELGILVHQLSEHPGAFTTYLRTQEPAPYAGLPTVNAATSDITSNAPSSAPIYPSMSASGGLFAPTLQNQPAPSYSDASLWGIEEEPTAATAATATYPDQTTNSSLAADTAAREYWERELDVKMVFSFLARRFSSRPSSPSPSSLPHQHRHTPLAPSPPPRPQHPSPNYSPPLQPSPLSPPRRPNPPNPSLGPTGNRTRRRGRESPARPGPPPPLPPPAARGGGGGAAE